MTTPSIRQSTRPLRWLANAHALSAFTALVACDERSAAPDHVSEDDAWHIPVYLTEITHTPLLPRKVVTRLTKLDRRLRAANEFGMRRKAG